MKKRDLILLAVLLSVALLGLGFSAIFLLGKGDVVAVKVDGVEILCKSLDEEGEYPIVGYGGGTNLLVIRDGAAWIAEASCPDKICVRSGHANELKSVVCAPNRVVVEIRSKR